MTNYRPLETILARALYALHRAIEAKGGLISNILKDLKGNVCAIGALSHDGQMGDEFNKLLNDLGLQDPIKSYSNDGTFRVEALNDQFKGTPEERCEFMLRHIVSELHYRQLSLPEENTAGTPHQHRREEVKV